MKCKSCNKVAFPQCEEESDGGYVIMCVHCGAVLAIVDRHDPEVADREVVGYGVQDGWTYLYCKGRGVAGMKATYVVSPFGVVTCEGTAVSPLIGLEVMAAIAIIEADDGEVFAEADKEEMPRDIMEEIEAIELPPMAIEGVDYMLVQAA